MAPMTEFMPEPVLALESCVIPGRKLASLFFFFSSCKEVCDRRHRYSFSNGIALPGVPFQHVSCSQSKPCSLQVGALWVSVLGQEQHSPVRASDQFGNPKRWQCVFVVDQTRTWALFFSHDVRPTSESGCSLSVLWCQELELQIRSSFPERLFPKLSFSQMLEGITPSECTSF